jgi:hypothetical protein
MQSSLEFYLSAQVSKLGNPFAVRSKKLNVHTVSILEAYQLNVQRLFDYGMYVCRNNELVTESLLAVFVHVRNQNNLSGTKKFVRLLLFKRFRTHVTKRMSALKKLRVVPDLPVKSCDSNPGRELTPLQLFLKIKCEFSYLEVAAVMNIRTKSAYNLACQALKSYVMK